MKELENKFILAKDLEEGDRITFTSFPRHNATVLEKVEMDSCFKIVMKRQFSSKQEKLENPERIITMHTPKNRKFPKAIDIYDPEEDNSSKS